MTVKILIGDALETLRTLADGSVHCVLTSPPYLWQRDYGTAEWEGGGEGCDHVEKYNLKQDSSGGVGGGRIYGTRGEQPSSTSSAIGYRHTCAKCGATRIDKQLGLEATPELFIENMVEVFREARRVLRDDGVCFINLGDSYNANTGSGFNGQKRYDDANRNTKRASTLPAKNLLGIPWRVALALQADGWWLRSAPPWIKKNPMPESVTDRPTTGHENWFMLTKKARYFWDGEAVRVGATGNTHSRGTKLSPPKEKDGAAAGNGHLGWVESTPDKVSTRNRRTSDWFFESLDILIDEQTQYLAHLKEVKANGGLLLDEDDHPLAFVLPTHPFPGSHFATFNPALVEPIIKAGTSEHGCCPECGAPWERDIIKKANYTKRQDRGQYNNTAMVDSSGWNPATVTDNGWRPTCDCSLDNYYFCPCTPIRAHINDLDHGCPECGETMIPAPHTPIPCTVLDMFCGAGTVGLVADRLNRDAILIELKPEYAEMTRKRIADDAGWVTDIETSAPAEVQGSLFDV